GARLARQDVAATRFFRGDAERWAVGVVGRACQQACAARAAVAGLATVRQVESRAERGFQYRLSRRDAQRAPVRFDAYAVFLRAQVSGLLSDRRAAVSQTGARLDAPGRGGQGGVACVREPPGR